MPAPSDPHTPQPSPDAPTPADSIAPGAGKLLDEIRERLERLEGNLSLRERRVARLERTLRDADGKLQAERARYSAERESIEQGLPQQLRERDEQLANAGRERQELEKRLAAQDARERELRARIEQLSAERDQAAAYLTKAQHETRQLERSRRELEAQLEDLARRRGEWERMATAAPAKPAAPAVPVDLPRWLRRVVGLAQGWRKLPLFQRSAVIITLVVLPIVCVVAGITAYRHYPRTYRVEGSIAAPAEARALLTHFERPAAEAGEPAFDRLDVRRLEASPLIVASMLVRERTPDRAIRQVNAELQSMLREVTAATTQPVAQPERQQLREQLEHELQQLDTQMAALATQPAQGPADPRTLLAGWQKTLDERKALDAAIAQLDLKLQEPSPEASAVQITPEQVSAALAADPRLQADSAILVQREADLAAVLRKRIDAVNPTFASLAASAAAADQYFETALKETNEQDVTEALQVIRNALSNCAKATNALSQTWTDERKALDASGADISAHYQKVETAARDFLESTGNSLTLLNKSLDAIGSGGNNPTTRLVLRANVARQIQPALDARDTLATAGRQLTGGEDVELATLAQQAASLRAQVQDRRTRLEQLLHGQQLAELRAAHEQSMQQTRAKRDELAARSAGMDAEIVRGASQALGLLGGSQAREAALARLVEMTRTRPELAGKLAALDRATAEENAAASRLGTLNCRAATATELTSPRALAAWTIVGSMAPLLVLVIVGVAFWAFRAWRQPRASLDDYAKALSSRKLTKRAVRK